MGKFVKGQSGNPNGRPPGYQSPERRIGFIGVMDVKALAREWTPESINTLADIMKDVAAPASSRVAAANSLLDRGWGKPHQSVEATVNGRFDDRSDDELKRIIEGTIISIGPDSGGTEFEDIEEDMPE
jgi:hypothetical protein